MGKFASAQLSTEYRFTQSLASNDFYAKAKCVKENWFNNSISLSTYIYTSICSIIHPSNLNILMPLKVHLYAVAQKYMFYSSMISISVYLNYITKGKLISRFSKRKINSRFPVIFHFCNNLLYYMVMTEKYNQTIN